MGPGVLGFWLGRLGFKAEAFLLGLLRPRLQLRLHQLAVLLGLEDLGFRGGRPSLFYFFLRLSHLLCQGLVLVRVVCLWGCSLGRVLVELLDALVEALLSGGCFVKSLLFVGFQLLFVYFKKY